MCDNKSLDLILKKIDESPELTLFFTELMKLNSSIAKIFLLHKDELFLGDESTKLPYLFWNNFPIKKTIIEDFRTVETLVKLGDIKSKQALRIFPGFFKPYSYGLNMSEELIDLFLYTSITLARQNESIKNLVTSDNFSFRLMKNALKNYKDLCLKFPDELPKDDEYILKKKAMQLAAPLFEDMRAGKIFNLIETLPYIIPDILMSFHNREANIHLYTLLLTSEMEKDVYTELIDYLFSINLVINVHTIFWCENCRDQLPLLRTTSQLSPHHLQIQCPRCKKPMYVSSIFRIDEILRKCIFSQDGLLTIALAFLLMKNDVNYEFSVHNKHEYDFVCKIPIGNILLECKMHRKPINERSISGKLGKDLKQTNEHFTTLQEENSSFIKGYIVYNTDLEQYSTIIDKISKKYEHIEVLDPNDLDDLIQRIKSIQE